eukprot:gene25847-31215_t
MEEDELIDIIHDTDIITYATHDGLQRQSNWLEVLVRAGRSTGPKEVLLKLAINRHLLQMQLAAVQIQTHYRRYAAQVRVNIIKRRLKLFHRLTEQIASIMMEEIILTMALEMSIDIVESRDHLQLMKSSMGRAMESISHDTVHSVASRMMLDIVKETIAEATDAFLAIVKAKPVIVDTLLSTSNPLIRVVLGICDEVSDTYIRPVVIECILEEVKEYLYANYAQAIYAQIYQEELLSILIEACDYESIVDYEFRPTLLPLLAALHDRKQQLVNAHLKKPQEDGSPVASKAEEDGHSNSIGEEALVQETTEPQELVRDFVTAGLQNTLLSILSRRFT